MLQLISLILYSVYAQTPPEVWISPKYDLSTPGWDTIRFDTIQDGIDAVAKGGSVYIDTGVYYESIIIKKNLRLLGEGPDVTEINADSSQYAAFIEKVSGGSISGISFTNASEAGIYIYASDSINIQNNAGSDNGESGIIIDECENLIIYNNSIYDHCDGLTMSNSYYNQIINNNIIGTWALFLSNSCGNRIENNEFLGFTSTVSLYNASNNNLIINNTIEANEACNLIRSLHSRNNFYANNILKGNMYASGINLSYSQNSVIFNNEISEFFQRGIRLYHADSTIILANSIFDPVNWRDPQYNKGGILVFGESCNNLIKGNTILDTPDGISFHHNSNNNQIVNNLIKGSSTGIIMHKSDSNTIYKNNLEENLVHGFDNGKNVWSFNGIGNYWSDYSNSDNDCFNQIENEYQILPNGIDNYPSETSFNIEPVDTPAHDTISIIDLPTNINCINNDTIWENQYIELSGLCVNSGCTLTINNTTVNLKSDGKCGGGVICDGATFFVNNSTIFFNGKELVVEHGAKFEIRNSKIYNAGNWGGNGGIANFAENVVFEGNLIYDIWGIGYSSNSKLTNNHFINICEGINFEGSNIIVDSNTFQNAINSGININGRGSGNEIFDNKFIDCWDKAITIINESSNNKIYRNSFLSHYKSVYAGGNDSTNIWNMNDQGNFYSDYLDRYPSAKENELTNNIWDIPYKSWKNNIDEYPSMKCFYSDTVIDTPNLPILVSPDSNSYIEDVVPIFEWLNSDNAESYRIQISEDSTFSSPIVNKRSLFDTTYCCLLDTNTTYYWRVISLNEGGYSNWSETWEFTICESFDRVDSITIEPGESYKGHTEKGTYIENLKTVFGCDSIITTVLDIEEPSQILSFQLNQTMIKVFPNPTSGKITLALENITDKIIVNIFSINGESVYNKLYTDSDNKISEIIDLQNHAKGIYFINISNGLVSKTEKIVIK